MYGVGVDDALSLSPAPCAWRRCRRRSEPLTCSLCMASVSMTLWGPHLLLVHGVSVDDPLGPSPAPCAWRRCRRRSGALTCSLCMASVSTTLWGPHLLLVHGVGVDDALVLLYQPVVLPLPLPPLLREAHRHVAPLALVTQVTQLLAGVVRVAAAGRGGGRRSRKGVDRVEQGGVAVDAHQRTQLAQLLRRVVVVLAIHAARPVGRTAAGTTIDNVLLE